MKKLFSVLCLLLSFVVVPNAFAHRPEWGDASGQMRVANLRTSFAYYRELRQPEVYVFEAQAGERLHAGINIPAIAGLVEYNVNVALFGPGLPPLDPMRLPPLHPDSLNGVIIPSVQGDDFFEPFTQTNYWGRQRINLTLPQTGTYYLVVWNPLAKTGKYVLDIGIAEEFSLLDLFVFPAWWVQVHLFFEHTPQLVLASLGVLSFVFGFVVVGWRKIRP